MKNQLHSIICLFTGCLLILTASAAELSTGISSNNIYAKWQNGPPKSESFFPIAVWLQSPAKAAQYRAAGINTYVGLWDGPTEEQLSTLSKSGMKLICSQNEVALRHLKDPIIIGWMHGDEPDNAQSLGKDKGYGPPILPEKIIKDFEAIRAADPSRPVMLNLGQGVAWDKYYGRGVRTNHPEDYAQYMKGCDIASFDIYPACHDSPEIAGKLWYVAQGVSRLVQWSEGSKTIWDCIECTRISNPTKKATPLEVRGEVWMSLIHGSMGLIYFAHEWEPKFNEAALLSDPEMLTAVTAINRQITQLAPVLNTPTLKDHAQVSSENSEVPIAIMAKRYQGALYLFAVAMRAGNSTATFTIQGGEGEKTVEVLDENRTISSKSGIFKDQFKAWETHLYRAKL